MTSLGAQTIRLPGRTRAVKLRRGPMTSPSSSTGRSLSNCTSTVAAVWCSSCHGCGRLPVITCQARPSQCAGDVAVSTAMSRSPSSGRACGSSAIPPVSVPTFPMRTPTPRVGVTTPSRVRRRSSLRAACSARAPATTYAPQPMRLLSRSEVKSNICASKPAPPMTAKTSPSSSPTSITRCSPVATSLIASSRVRGTSRLRANRFPVPSGSKARGTSPPTSALMAARTVPSPPHARMRSAPSARACCVCPSPGSSAVVSIQLRRRQAVGDEQGIDLGL